MKKKIAIIMASIVLVGAFAGCAPKKATSTSASSVDSASSAVSSIDSTATSSIDSSVASSSVSSSSSVTSTSSKTTSVAPMATTTSTTIAAVKSSVAAGPYTFAISVTLTCSTSGATIYYTTDGSSPTTASTKYTAAFNVSKTTTIEAIAVKGVFASAVATFAYTLNIPLNLSGIINYDGSSALAPLIDLASAQFKKLYPKVTIPTAGTKGSGTGVSLVLAKSIDIGGSDVFATNFTDAKTASNLVDHQICVIGFAAVIDKSLGITNLTTAQLKSAFTDSTKTTWNQIDPSFPNKPITVVVRAAGSGTRVVFDSTALGGATVRSDAALVTGTSSGNVETIVNSTPGAIGYLALSYTVTSASTNVLPLNLNGIAPTYANIYSGAYNIIGYEHAYTYGTPNATVQAFLDYMTSSAFQSTITSNGYGLISLMK